MNVIFYFQMNEDDLSLEDRAVHFASVLQLPAEKDDQICKVPAEKDAKSSQS